MPVKSEKSNKKTELVITTDARFIYGKWGVMGESGRYGQGFFQEALDVFDSVTIIARMHKSEKPPRDDLVMNLSFKWYPLPTFRGITQGLKCLPSLLKYAYKYSREGKIHLLRLPGIISALMWFFLIIQKKKYGAEVIGFAKDALTTSGSRILFFLSFFFDIITKIQCRYASATSYVTKWNMPYMYPCKNQFFIADTRLPENVLGKKKIFSKPPCPVKILHIGTMHTLYKGQEVLFKAIKQVLDSGINCELTMVGDGCYRNRFEILADGLGISEKVKFLGEIPGGLPILNLMDEHDLLVFPSFTEGLPNVLVEAIMKGLPVIASNVGGIPELIDKEFLVPPGNSEFLAEKIIDVVRDIHQLNYMSERNIEKAKEYLPEKLRNKRREFLFYLKQIAMKD